MKICINQCILLVDSVNYIHIQESKGPKMWDNLEKTFNDKGLTRRVSLLRDCITTKLEGCQNIEDYVINVMVTA